MAERGVYGTIFGYGVGLGWDDDNGITLSGFKSSSVGVAGDAWVAVSWGGGWEGVSVYVGGGVPTGVPSPITGSIQQNINTGSYYINLGTGVTDRAEVGVYYEGDVVVEVDWTTTERTLGQLYDGDVLASALRELANAKTIPQDTQAFINKYGDLVQYKNFIPETSDIPGTPNTAAGNDQCFLGDTPIQMWPLNPLTQPCADGTYDEQQIPSSVWEKPIKEISAGDVVLSYDKDGNLQPGHVVRTFRNEATHILDFWGTGVTPGHAYLCADGVLKDQHVPLMDILRTDGAIMRDDGTLVRASTNCEVGSAEDQFVLAVVGAKQPNGRVRVSEARKIRVGTRVVLENGQDTSLLELITAGGGTVTADGMVQTSDSRKLPFRWELSDHLPAPEDYILQRSDVTLKAIYAAGEWESIGTKLPAPLTAGDAPVSNAALVSQPAPNIPPAFADRPDTPVVQSGAVATSSLS